MIGNIELYFQVLLLLGHLLRLAYLKDILYALSFNDSVGDIHSCIRLFADDTNVFPEFK